MTALPAPSIELDDQLCFALYAASRAVTARYRPMLDAIGLVTRHRRVEDERSVSIALTDEGRGLREKAFAISEEMIGTIGFETGEFDDLKAKLRLLTERVSTGAGTS